MSYKVFNIFGEDWFDFCPFFTQRNLVQNLYGEQYYSTLCIVFGFLIFVKKSNLMLEYWLSYPTDWNVSLLSGCICRMKGLAHASSYQSLLRPIEASFKRQKVLRPMIKANNDATGSLVNIFNIDQQSEFIQRC